MTPCAICGILGVQPNQGGRSHLLERSLRQLERSVHFTQDVALDALGQTLTRARLEAVWVRCGVSEQRVRKRTLVLAVLVCVAMNLFTEEAIDDVLYKLLHGVRFLRPAEERRAASASAICQRRQQLGVAPRVALFREVCHPLATPATRDAFRFGWRLRSLDGTTEDVPDTPANAAYFGRAHGARGDRAFPQVNAVSLCESGTPAICDAGFWPYAVSERVGGLRRLRSVGPEMRVLWDRGFHSYAMAVRGRHPQAHFLARLPAHVQWTPVQRLDDGSYRAYLQPSAYQRRKDGERLWVRGIEYPLDDPTRPGHGERHRLITSLWEAHGDPAQTLACADPERWEIEITLDEMDTPPRHPPPPLRSRTPLGVLQELYGLWVAP